MFPKFTLMVFLFHLLLASNRIKAFIIGTDARFAWQKWKRAIEIYFDAEEVTDPKKKQKKLLHLGGEEIQEIVTSFPDDPIEVLDDDGKVVSTLNEYEALISRLDDFFAPRLNVTFERHTLRNIRQNQGEKFEAFCVRIRNQIAKCDYCDIDKDLEIIQQIIEGCVSKELRSKLLNKDRPLIKVMEIGRNLEELQYQKAVFGGQNEYSSETVHRIGRSKSFQPKSTTGRSLQPRKSTGSQDIKSQYCYRCGSKNHFANDSNCPAVNVVCNSCNKKGHFMKVCRTKKRKLEFDENVPPMKTRRVEEFGEPSDFGGVFHITSRSSSKKCSATIGGMMVSVIIDSGSDVNLITFECFQGIQASGGPIWNLRSGVNERLRCYGQRTGDDAIEISYSFVTIIEVGTR